jgi:hypothetical protein
VDDCCFDECRGISWAVSVTFSMVLVTVNEGKLICVSSVGSASHLYPGGPWQLPQSAAVNSPKQILAFICSAVALVTAWYSTKVVMWQIKVKARSLVCKFLIATTDVSSLCSTWHGCLACPMMSNKQVPHSPMHRTTQVSLSVRCRYVTA